MSSTSQKLYSNMFDQVAEFGVSGLSASMVMALLGGCEAVYPWF